MKQWINLMALESIACIRWEAKRDKIHQTNCLKWVIHSALAPSNRERSKHWKTALPIVWLHSEWPLLHGDILCSLLNALNLARFFFIMRVTGCQHITHILLIPIINYLRYLFDKCYLLLEKKNNNHFECKFLGLVLTELQFLAFQSKW